MQTSLALINGAYGVIRPTLSIDEASQHFDDRQAVLDASDDLDPVFDNLNTLLEMNGFTDVLKKDGPQPIEVKNNDNKTLADFLDSNNISQDAFLLFRSACNDLQVLKGNRNFLIRISLY